MLIKIDHEKLKRLRKERNISMRDLSLLLGIDHSSISRYEKGETRIPGDVLITMLLIYGVDMKDIIVHDKQTDSIRKTTT